MKIALITDSYTATNGVSRTYQQFAQYCQSQNIELDIFTIGKKLTTKKIASVNIFEFPAALPIKYYPDLPPFDLKFAPAGFKQKLLAGNYDIFHLATPGSLGIAARIILAKNTKPKIGVFHTQLDEYAKNLAQKILKKFPDKLQNSLINFSQLSTEQALKWFYSNVNLILAPSLATAEKIKKFNKPVKLFPRGIDTTLFNPQKSKRPKDNKLVALYVGRLSTEKNLDLLAAIWQTRKDYELWLVGDGPDKKELQKKLPTAKFFGQLTGEKLSEVYASADVFIFPSRTDTFGNAVLEAQASGLPCLVTNVGGPQEIIKDKISGFVLKPNAYDFNRGLDLLKIKITRAKMSQQARENCLAKTWPTAFEKLIKIYQTLM
ncbi:MAG: glycosyltransferase [Patescibacteria group bacterium]|nr:glycosyltransferase [Patescibacteria group bacterium]